MTLAAAVAFYTALSLAPILVVLLWVASVLGPETQQSLVDRITETVGTKAGEVVQTVVTNAAEQPNTASIAGYISIAVALFSATGAFAQLQHALNRIWNVERKPGQGVKGAIGKRLVSLLMLIVLGVILFASVAASAVLTAIIGQAEDILPGAGWIWQVLNWVISVIVFVVLFAAIFKILPDVKMDWRDVWLGATVTALLFAIGKFLLGFYLARAGTASAYGAAGSLLAFLLWVYYSTIILFLGAELTQVWARRNGRRFEPDANARWMDAPEGRDAEYAAARAKPAGAM